MKGLIRKDFYLLWSYCRLMPLFLLACIIFSQFASSPPVVTEGLAPAMVVWNYIGELVFNMLVLVGSIKMSDRIIRELMGLG